jgi:hypothetical protein
MYRFLAKASSSIAGRAEGDGGRAIGYQLSAADLRLSGGDRPGKLGKHGELGELDELSANGLNKGFKRG